MLYGGRENSDQLNFVLLLFKTWKAADRAVIWQKVLKFRRHLN